MKKTKKTMLTAAALMTAVSLSSCYAVYGPPPDISESSSESDSFDPAQEEMQDVYGPPPAEMEEVVTEAETFESSEQDIAVVYGPLSDLDESSSEEETAEPTTFEPSKQEVAVVYGPPPDMD